MKFNKDNKQFVQTHKQSKSGESDYRNIPPYMLISSEMVDEFNPQTQRTIAELADHFGLEEVQVIELAILLLKKVFMFQDDVVNTQRGVDLYFEDLEPPLF